VLALFAVRYLSLAALILPLLALLVAIGGYFDRVAL
jgi:hypothetical protein